MREEWAKNARKRGCFAVRAEGERVARQWGGGDPDHGVEVGVEKERLVWEQRTQCQLRPTQSATGCTQLFTCGSGRGGVGDAAHDVGYVLVREGHAIQELDVEGSGGS
eukprot:1445388-Rhodomonas_salina.2